MNESDFDIVDNVILYGFIKFKCDYFYVYSGTMINNVSIHSFFSMLCPGIISIE
jgi:hypothetical protein